MAKKISISEQIEELQAENERLNGLHKLFDKAVKMEFGYSIKEVHSLLNKQLQFEQRKQRNSQGQQSSERSED